MFIRLKMKVGLTAKLFSGKLNYLQIKNPHAINLKAHRGLHPVHAGSAGCTGINMEQTEFPVIHDFKYV